MNDMDPQIRAIADLWAEGYEPEDITILAIVDHEVRRLVNSAVSFTLSAKNLDRPRDGKYAPEWYVAKEVGTYIHEGLRPLLNGLLRCDSVHDGKCCVGSILHATDHWDGAGASWPLHPPP